MRWDVSRETRAQLERFARLVISENAVQNLVGPGTVEDFWGRHIVDSLQLGLLIGPDKSIADIGSGAGLPGIVLACAGFGPVTLIEPRRLRADFLQRTVDELALPVTVVAAKAEAVSGRFDVITGRAVAKIDRFLTLTHHLAHASTVWVLPKGRSAQSELEQARRNWQCAVEARPSRTDPEATIFVLSKVKVKRSS